MGNEDIKWKQRFQNFENAVVHLKDAVLKADLSDLEKAGVIQIYEFTFELAWKTVKDFLEEKQVPVKYPKDTIKEAFKYEIIDNGDLWIDMLEKRNLMSHTYNETNAELAYNLITGQYFGALEQLYLKLKSEL
jgi:nucleotidyltransferase substrate binding protein (TIGR01987 family)